MPKRRFASIVMAAILLSFVGVQAEDGAPAENWIAPAVTAEAPPVSVEPPRPPSAASPLRVYAEADLWLALDAYAAAEHANEDYARASGFRTPDSEYTNGYGGRIGLWLPTRTGGLSWGPSIGYVTGPSADFRVSYRYAASNTSVEVRGSSAVTSFIRVLAEFRKDLPLTERVAFRWRAGLGLARGTMREDFRSSGQTFASQSKEWVGLAWELGPAMVFSGDRLRFGIGAVYAGYPTMEEKVETRPWGPTYTLHEFRWTPVGVRAGVEF